MSAQPLPEPERKCSIKVLNFETGAWEDDWDAHNDLEESSGEYAAPPGVRYQVPFEFRHSANSLIIENEKYSGTVPVTSLRTSTDFDQAFNQFACPVGAFSLFSFIQELLRTKSDLSDQTEALKKVGIDIQQIREFIDEIEEALWFNFRQDISFNSLATWLLRKNYSFEWPKSTAGELSTKTPDEILAMEFDDSDKIIGEYIVALEQSSVWVGPPGTHKSGLALIAAVSCITGRPFLGFKTFNTDARWLFIQTENSNKRLNSDLRKLRAWVGDDEQWRKVEAQLVVHTIDKDIDCLLHLDSEQNKAELAKLVSRHSPDVVVFDPLRDFACGDLNVDGDMARTCAEISRVSRKGNPKRAIIILHHALTGKTGASRATGYDRSSFGRNSKVLFGWTRAQINIAPASENDNNTLIIACGKNSNGPEFAPFAVEFDNDALTCSYVENFDFDAWKDEVSSKPANKKTQRPLTAQDLLPHILPGATINKAVLIQKIVAATSRGEKAAAALVTECVDAKQVHEWRIKRHRKRDDIHIGRTPQPPPEEGEQ